MASGFKQILIFLAVVLIVFGPMAVRFIRRFSGGGASSGRAVRRRADHVHCPHCRAENPEHAKYCCACGKPLDFVDV